MLLLLLLLLIECACASHGYQCGTELWQYVEQSVIEVLQGHPVRSSDVARIQNNAEQSNNRSAVSK